MIQITLSFHNVHVHPRVTIQCCEEEGGHELQPLTQAPRTTSPPPRAMPRTPQRSAAAWCAPHAGEGCELQPHERAPPGERGRRLQVVRVGPQVRAHRCNCTQPVCGPESKFKYLVGGEPAGVVGRRLRSLAPIKQMDTNLRKLQGCRDPIRFKRMRSGTRKGSASGLALTRVSAARSNCRHGPVWGHWLSTLPPHPLL